ncbi:MAG: hypothetical protein ABIR63_05430 [Sphingomicrobium sp.]
MDQEQHPAARWLMHMVKMVGATVICAAFVVMLMIATAEQQVVSRMTAQGLSGDYDQALLMHDLIPNDRTAWTVQDDKVISAFSGMDGLQAYVGNLVYVSPPLLQLLTTFVSGLFGALMVTLVLIVYPSNQIMTTADARPVTRTFLGGLIALCVYIVLLGGTAVLGSGSSHEGAGSNYMAFAGIGILAGMFSDRVAGWLSNRADEFFKQ